MIIALATLCLFLFGSGGLEFYLTNLKDPVKEHVADEARQDAILDAGKALSKQMKDVQKEVEKQFAAYVDAHADFESTPQDFDAVTENMVAQQKKLSGMVLETRAAMHSQMTEAEWRAVFNKP